MLYDIIIFILKICSLFMYIKYLHLLIYNVTYLNNEFF